MRLSNLKKWFTGSKKPATIRRNASRLHVEGLETRLAMAAGVTAALGDDGVLRITGTSGDDKIYVLQSDGPSQAVWVGKTMHGQELGVFPTKGAAKVVKRVEVVGGGGSDLIDLLGTHDAHHLKLESTVYGDTKNVNATTGGNDTIIGGDNRDWIYGGGGKDTINGQLGVDRIYGGAGNDTLYGSSGSDHLWGDDGNDKLFGGNQTDTLYGGAGDDFLDTGSASESVIDSEGTNYNAWVWTTNGTTETDIDQDDGNRCVMLSALSQAARAGVNLNSRIEYLGNGQYTVSLYRQATKSWEKIEVSFTGDTHLGDADSVDSRTTANGVDAEFWTILYQRAYIKMYFGVDPANEAKVLDLPGDPTTKDRVLAALTGWKTGHIEWRASATADLSMTAASVGATLREWVTGRDVVIIGGGAHAYGIAEVKYNSATKSYLVRLYNPVRQDRFHALASGITIQPGSDTVNDGKIWAKLDDLLASTQFRHAYRAINPSANGLV